MSVLDDLARDLDDQAEDADDTVGGSPGPLSEPDRTTVLTILDVMELLCSQILFQVDDAGTATKALPATLPLVADKCHELASEMRAETGKFAPDPTYVGNRAKTIRYLINATNGYRHRTTG